MARGIFPRLSISPRPALPPVPSLPPAALPCLHCRSASLSGDLFCGRCGWELGTGNSADPTRRLAGRFRVLRLGGEGASGTVSLAEDEQTGQRVAVKELFQDPRLRERLRREVSLLEGLQHPGIVPHLGVWFEPDAVFAVMPWIEGASLREILDAGGALSQPEVLWLGAMVARALTVAHRRGIVHRDIKPANILVDLHGDPHVCDFGIAKAEGSVDLTRTGGAVGSPAYMSPEQVQGDYVPASDQYSLGVVCWELLAGHRPFLGSAFEVQLAHLTDPAPPLPVGHEPDSSQLAAIVQRMLQKRPERRWSSLEAVADALESVDSDPIVARAALATRVARARRRRHYERLLEVTTSVPVRLPDAWTDRDPSPERARELTGPAEWAPADVSIATPMSPASGASAVDRQQGATRSNRLATRVLVGSAFTALIWWSWNNERIASPATGASNAVATSDTASREAGATTADNAAAAPSASVATRPSLPEAPRALPVPPPRSTDPRDSEVPRGTAQPSDASGAGTIATAAREASTGSMTMVQQPAEPREGCGTAGTTSDRRELGNGCGWRCHVGRGGAGLRLGSGTRARTTSFGGCARAAALGATAHGVGPGRRRVSRGPQGRWWRATSPYRGAVRRKRDRQLRVAQRYRASGELAGPPVVVGI
jgi:eukaryotic-like serine/threonine-protein kinase